MLKTFLIGKYRITLCWISRIGLDKPENQDAIAFGASADSFVISVCDGLGSAKLSSEGSKKAAELLVASILGHRFNKIDFQKEWLDCFPGEPQKYNSTAKFVVVENDSIHCGGIGDGIIAVYADNEIRSYTYHGDFSNQTSCIFDVDYERNFVDENLPLKAPISILISTDGFSEDIKDDGLEILLKAAFDALQSEDAANEFDSSLEDLLKNWPNPTNGDDKTVAFILVEEKQ